MAESVYKKREATKKEKQVRTAVAKLMRKLRKLEEPIRERMARERSERAAKLKGTPPPEKTPDQHIREFAAEIVKAKPAAPVADAFNVARKVIEAPGVGLPPRAQPQPRPFDFPGDKNLNLVINTLFVNNDGNVYELEGHPDRTLYFRNGLFVGNENPDVGDPPAGLITEYSTHLSIAP